MSTRKSKPARPHKATREQERERARRRAVRREKSDATARAERRRTLQAVVVVIAVLALVGAVVALSRTLGADPTTSQTAAATDASQGATASGTLPDNCDPAPAAPGTTAQLDLPGTDEVAGKVFEAVITTNCGDVTVELDGTRAPQAVASFVDLADRGYYADSPCHRLLASGNVVLQCGDPTGTGTGGPGYGYGVEDVPEDGLYPRGTLAMARTADLEEGTGSQFFVVQSDSVWPPEGGGYTIFGNVTSGMDIIDQVVAAGVADGGVDGPPALPLSILRIAVTEK
ncbi:MAG: peptidylprolyl isomerase [Dermatophilaceae bacterium]|nr:peptidylprolyl isomerase [Intrasporangiaceae bacterium]